MGFLFGTKERKMFADYYDLCQTYFVIGADKDKYWDELWLEAKKFNEKYKDIGLAWYIMSAFLTSQEMKEMEMNHERNTVGGSTDVNQRSTA